MTDRDDYPNNPYRGRTSSRGDGYDPLSDPLPAHPPPRGRRARPEPRQEDPGSGEFRHAGPAAGEFGMSPYARPTDGENDPPDQAGPPPGRRRRTDPPPADAPRRSSGAADAVRGGRAARSDGARLQRPEPGDPAADPTQDALAALANLGAPSGQNPPPGSAEPPRRGRTARAEEEAAAPSPLWAEREDEPTPAFFADTPDEEPRGRRARRGRDTGGFPQAAEDSRRTRRKRAERVADAEGASAQSGASPHVESKEERRGRRRRARRDDADVSGSGFLADTPEDGGASDTGDFPGAGGQTDTGGFSRVDETAGRRRRRGVPPSHGTGAFAEHEPDHGADTEGLREAGGDLDGTRAAAHDSGEHRVTGDVPDGEEAEPQGRRGRRKRAQRTTRQQRRRRKAERAEESAQEETGADEDDGDDEPQLADIAEAYGGGRRSRRKLKEAKRKASGKTRRRRRKGPMVALCLALILVIAGGGYGVVRAYVFPPDYAGDGEGEVVFVIEDGESGAAVADNLADAGVVASPRAFTNALRRATLTVRYGQGFPRAVGAAGGTDTAFRTPH